MAKEMALAKEEMGLTEISREDLRLMLEKAGVNLEVSEKGVEALRKKKYTEKHPNRRLGLVEVWGEEAVVVDDDSDKGLSVERFNKRTYWRVEKGVAYKLMREAKEKGVESDGYKEALNRYKLVKKESKDALSEEKMVNGKIKRTIGIVAMVPPEAAEMLWQSLQGGKLPGVESVSDLK